MARVAVVTGFYNRGEFLERTIDSILNQSFSDFELLVFDDNSRDDTADRLEALSWAYGDPRFRYRSHATNTGFVAGLKSAIADTTSEYIAIQGSGDVSLADRLSAQVEYLDAHPDVAVVGGWYYNVQEAQGTRILRKASAEGLGLSDLMSRNVFSHGEVMIRRSAYEAVGGYRAIFKYAQDRDLWLRLARAGFAFGTVPKPVYERYVLFDGVSYVPSKVAEQACYSVAAERLAALDDGVEASVVERIARSGIESFVPKHDSLVQSKLSRAAVRMILFGNVDAGSALAKEYVPLRVRRWPILALSITSFRWLRVPAGCGRGRSRSV